MILLAEKNQIRKNIGFDLSDPDQKLAYDILEMKRGKSLSRFLAKSIIIGEMIERKMQTDKIERRGNELLNSFDNFPINTNTVSTPIVKEKRKKKKTGRICCANETKCRNCTDGTKRIHK